jgi:hypothetical protein
VVVTPLHDPAKAKTVQAQAHVCDQQPRRPRVGAIREADRGDRRRRMAHPLKQTFRFEVAFLWTRSNYQILHQA